MEFILPLLLDFELGVGLSIVFFFTESA